MHYRVKLYAVNGDEMNKILCILIIFYLWPHISQAQTNNGLIDWWKFDEGSGSTAIDSGSGGHNGTEVNGPTYIHGVIGPYALNFNASNNNYISLGNVLNTSGTTNFSVSGWFLRGSQPGQYTRAIGSETASNTGFAIIFGPPTDQTLYINRGGGSFLVIPYTAFSSTQFVMITMTYDGSKSSVYLNGVFYQKVTSDTSSAPSQTAWYIAETAYSQAGFGAYNGDIDDVRIYNRALTAGEVYELFEAGAANHLGDVF